MIPSLAYVDPSVMSYAVQAVAGILIASGVVFGVVWRKLKRKAQKAFHIDENAGKEVEADLVVSVDSAETSTGKTDRQDS
jgi:hypothetical protein